MAPSALDWCGGSTENIYLSLKDALNTEYYGVILMCDKEGALVLRKARPRPSDIRKLDRRVAMMLNQR